MSRPTYIIFGTVYYWALKKYTEVTKNDFFLYSNVDSIFLGNLEKYKPVMVPLGNQMLWKFCVQY